MGGLNETKINGLRMHIEGGDVHVHDDSKSLKFSLNQRDFKKEIDEVMKSEGDGVSAIEGRGASLCVVKRGKTTGIFLMDMSAEVSKDLLAFSKNC
jgi:hypothetical protein